MLFRSNRTGQRRGAIAPVSTDRLQPYASRCDSARKAAGDHSWAERDSNPRRRKSADLQSALVGRLSISPNLISIKKEPIEGLEPTTC